MSTIKDPALIYILVLGSNSDTFPKKNIAKDIITEQTITFNDERLKIMLSLTIFNFLSLRLIKVTCIQADMEVARAIKA